MAEPLHNEDLLMKYLDGEMDASEKALFEEQLQKDAGLKQSLQQLQTAIGSVRQYGTVQKVKAVHQQMMQELAPLQKEARVLSMKKAVRYSLAIAASIIIILVGVNLFSTPGLSSRKLYNEAFVDYNVSAVRGSSATTSLEKLYQDKNYTAVIARSGAESLSSTDSLLVGLAYLKTDQLTKAIDRFRTISAQSPVRPDADFYLALAYLKNKNYPQALQWMEQTRSHPGHVYHAQFPDEFIQRVKELSSK